MTTAAGAPNRVYEDIELPSSAEWVQEQGYETLVVNLQGYKKENLKIQVPSTRNIRVLGERQVHPENNVWQRFRKEFPVPSNCDVNETTARFADGFLYVKIPKTTATAEAAANKNHRPQKPATGTPPPPPPPPTVAIPKPQKPTSSTSTYAAAKEQTPPSKAIKDNKTDGSSKANSGSQAKYANNAVTADSKAPEKEKVSAAVVSTDKPSRVNKSSATYEGMAEASTNGTSKKTSMEKEKIISDHEDVNYRGKRVEQDYSTKEDSKTEEYCSMRTRGRGYYRQVVDGVIMELKEPRKLVNLVVAFGFVLVLGLYVNYAVNSIEEFKRDL